MNEKEIMALRREMLRRGAQPAAKVLMSAVWQIRAGKTRQAAVTLEQAGFIPASAHGSGSSWPNLVNFNRSGFRDPHNTKRKPGTPAYLRAV